MVRKEVEEKIFEELKKYGLKIGDKVEHAPSGTICFLESAVLSCNEVWAKCNKVKKDGTRSLHRQFLQDYEIRNFKKSGSK